MKEIPKQTGSESAALVIDSLSLKGFKSFGNLCEFNFKGAGFTAIVGPNGNDK